MVDLGWILGGDAMTLESVSRMEVREGIIKAPEAVLSQYCLFYTATQRRWLEALYFFGGEGGILKVGDLGDVMYLFIINDHAITVCDINAICSSEPAFPKHAIHPREGDWFPKVFFSDTNPLALGLS